MSAQYQVSGDSAASISASIEDGVLRGDFVWGAALPPIRVLAGALHVSPATVAKAYQDLRHRGVVEAEGRRGTRVRSRPPIAGPRSALRMAVPAGTRDLSSGEPDPALLPAVGPALHALAADGDRPGNYAVSAGAHELTDAAGPRFAADGIPVSDAEFIVTSGALDAVERLLTAHLKPGDGVAVEDPGWSNLFDLLAALGLRPVPFALDGQGPDRASFALALRSARAAVVTVRAQNPTGASVGAARAAELREVLAEHPELLLIEDDHAAELAEAPPHVLGPVTSAWAFVRSASKPFGPDLRVAVVAGDETTIARVAGRMRIGSGWVSTVLQGLLLRLWQDRDVAEAVRTAGKIYGRRRRVLCDALRARGVEAEGSAGINVWVRVADETRAVGLLRDQGYAVAPGSLFRIGSPPGIRITISSLDENEVPLLADLIAAAAHPAGADTSAR